MRKKKTEEYTKGKLRDMVHFIAVEFNLDEPLMRAKLIQAFPELKDLSRCANCHASMKSFWHPMNSGLVGILIKAINFVKENNRNEFHLQRDLKLTVNEFSNFTKLRFHGLMASKEKEDDEGFWLITKRGGQFLRGELDIPKSVHTFRNSVIGHSEETCNIRDYFRHFPRFESNFEFNLEQGNLI